ncbi:MAG: flippase, partial [Chitinophagaceae bacterium]|nr:flippase [Anaerolineae bacterium]
MRQRSPDFFILILLFLLPLGMFFQQTLGGRTLLPTENLYQYEPYATYQEVVRAPAVPHNHLLSDLVLQNMQWKAFIRESIAQRQVPLWNSHQFSGIPFMAAGQQSMLYPLSILYYVLPLTAAYGWFTVLNLWLAGGFMYLFMRGLGVVRVGATVSAVTYQLCGFFIASAVFPMITGAAVWLPLLLLMTELIIMRSARPLWVAIGAGALACNIFAGHAEMTIYTLLITGYYAAARLAWDYWINRRAKPLRPILIKASWFAIMIALGLGLGAIQLIPLYEFANTNWRAERADLSTVLSYAHRFRDFVQYLMPNFYGSPAHHTYFDWFSTQTVSEFNNAAGQPISYIDWGIKNYVESALYVGILPLALAAFALVNSWLNRKQASVHQTNQPPYRVIFFVLLLISLTFMFGLPTYAAIYILPGINQLNSPFRWVYAVTLGIAVLAGFGASTLAALAPKRHQSVQRFSYGLIGAGTAILGALLLSRIFFAQIEPLLDRIVNSMALANQAFSDGRMFYNYQFTNVLTFGLMTLGAGGVFWLARRSSKFAQGDTLPRQRYLAYLWQFTAVALIAVDLLIASWGFNSASDPLLLDFTPPSMQWLIDRQKEDGVFRYMTLEDTAQHAPLFQANMTMRYGLDDVRGYDSIIPAQYVAFMRETTPQLQLDYNRIAPLYVDRVNEIDWNRLSLLNVRYIITHKSVDLNTFLPPGLDPRYGIPLPPRSPAYEDEAVRIWEIDALPRVYIAQQIDPGEPLRLEDGINTGLYAALYNDTGREKFVDVSIAPGEIDSWLVLSETYAPGWKAFIRVRAGSQDEEQPLQTERVLENFIGVLMPRGSAEYTIRLVYSPTSFQIGLFGSVISAGLMIFLVGVWAWGIIFRQQVGESTTLSRLARNSIAPIMLNLFNRGIDFAFAFVMLRILGPEEAGVYQYAVVIFVWFDILTNFGLNTFLVREVARNRDRAAYYLLNTSLMRLILILIGVPLLVGFILSRQNFISPPLNPEALIALGLLYVGLLPSSLSTGLTALFYAFEKAEYPAAVATITTINKAIFGLIALLLGYGIVGLATVSIFLNFITLLILLYGARTLINFGRAGSAAIPYKPNLGLMGSMARQSWPLMLNHFLATIFFQIDVVILEAWHGARVVGQYGVAYKWLMAINVIPSFFTQALLPIMSRQSSADPAAFRRTYMLAIKLLVCIALPLAVLFTFTATALTAILGGSEYLPEGAIALQIMIWSIPIGWMNSLTQYVLISLDLQRRITGAFIIAVSLM